LFSSAEGRKEGEREERRREGGRGEERRRKRDLSVRNERRSSVTIGMGRDTGFAVEWKIDETNFKELRGVRGDPLIEGKGIIDGDQRVDIIREFYDLRLWFLRCLSFVFFGLKVSLDHGFELHTEIKAVERLLIQDLISDIPLIETFSQSFFSDQRDNKKERERKRKRGRTIEDRRSRPLLFFFR